MFSKLFWCNVVRLVGSRSDGYCTGRVEIYHNGEWGTVCDDGWDNNDANVVCKQLGCGPPFIVHASAYFGEGTGKIWLDDVGCSGNEKSLSECYHRGFGTHNCEHVEDAGVTCYRKYYPVRLTGPSWCAGRVEIYYNAAWQTVCDDGWDLNDAQVVCSQLNCGVAVAAPHSAYFGKGRDKILLDDVACMGNETHLTRCSHRGYLDHNCSHSQDAGVICSGEKMFSTNTEASFLFRCFTVTSKILLFNNAIEQKNQSNCLYMFYYVLFFPFSICLLIVPHAFIAGLSRLIGPSRCSGRVEIFNNGSWGTVCNNSWDINEARVICRQLGCGTSLSVLHFGEGIGEINEVTCTGSERYLPECSYSRDGAQNCNHSQDAGVICSGNVFFLLNVLVKTCSN
uniref:SRCR domain-containing protein n=1 Tax=Xiphophorus couchianus TaxID=32473 RepID=A0A3B5MJW2_9TELE